MMPMRWWMLLLVGLCAAGNWAAAEPPPDEKAEVAARAALEPAEVARRFFYALVTKDRQAIERYILPNPSADVLWKGNVANEQLRAAAGKQIEKLTFKSLKVGDKISVGGREYVVDEQQVNENRVLLWPEGFSMPVALVRRQDGWHLKADSIIADRLRTKADEDAKKAGPKTPVNRPAGN